MYTHPLFSRHQMRLEGACFSRFRLCRAVVVSGSDGKLRPRTVVQGFVRFFERSEDSFRIGVSRCNSRAPLSESSTGFSFVHDNHSAAAATMMCPRGGKPRVWGTKRLRASLWNFWRKSLNDPLKPYQNHPTRHPYMTQTQSPS